MHIVCDRDQLLTAFQMAASVTPLRTPKAILRNVKLQAQEGKATLIATDLELGVRIDVTDLDIRVPGTTILPAEQMGRILRELSDPSIDIRSDGTNLEVRGEHSDFRLPAQSPDEFPDVSPFGASDYFTMPVRVLKELIRRTLFATDTDSRRYALGGILLQFEADNITAVGTDGRRLAKMEGPIATVGTRDSLEPATIVPARSMQLIERLLTNADTEVHITPHASHILFSSQNVTLYSRLVEGRFPRWQDVLPTDRAGTIIQLIAGTIFSAVRQASVVASEDSRGIHFEFGNGTLVLSGVTADVGRSRVEVPIPYQDQVIRLKLDHRFVADFLKVLDNDTPFFLDVKDSESAALFRTEDGYAYVVMPLAQET